MQRSIVALVWILSAALACDVASAADTPPANSADQLQFQQKNVQAQMQELQERMYRLAELTREAEPDDAARLLMAVRKAREQLIIEQMRQALELLAAKDFTHAADEQAQVIKKLEELKKLLTSTDLDLQLQLEKLRSLNRAIAKLDVAIKEEKRQKQQVGALAEQQKKSPPLEAKMFAGVQQDQQQNRKATENIAQTVKDLGTPGATGAAGALGGACQSMSLAEGNLGAGKPGDAQAQQSEAIKSLRDARKQLQDERQRILQELERQVRRQVVENLNEMLERQKSIRAATETVVRRFVSGSEQQLSRETSARVKQLGGAQTAIVRIADQTIALIEETQFSVALPSALKRVQQKCAVVAGQLEHAKADAPIIDKQKQIERDLQDLLDTFKQLASSRMSPGGNSNCKGDANKLLAELKVVRMMQARANEETRGVNDERGGPVNVSPSLREKILQVRDGQADARDAMQRIQDQLNAPDEPTDEPPTEAEEDAP